MNEKPEPLELQSETSLASGYRGSELLALLQLLAEFHDLPFTQERALHGIPTENGELALSLFTRSALSIGIDAKIENRRPSQVSSVVFPIGLLFKNGNAGLALKKSSDGHYVTVQLAGSTAAQEMPLTEIDRSCLHQVVYAVPAKPSLAGSAASSQSRHRSGHWLWSAIFKFWPTWLYVAIAALVVNLLGLALPLFVMNVYDRVIPNNSIPTLWALVAGVALALFFDFLLRLVRSTLIDSSGRRIDMGVSSRLFEQALDLKMANRGSRAGELANQIREFESVRDFFTSTGLTSIIDLLFIGVFLWLLWVIVGPLALVALFAVPIVLVVTLLLQIPLARSVRNTQQAATNRHSILVESLVGIETVKAISAEGKMQKRWEDAVATSVRASSTTHFWSSLALYFTMLAQQAVSVTIIAWGVFLVGAGDITIGALIASNILAGRVLAPLGNIAMTLVRTQQSLSAYGFLNSLMKLDRDHMPVPDTKAKVGKGRLEVRNLAFAYNEMGARALDGVSLTMAPGERVGVIGRVGSGKSTLGKLLCGLYDASEGAIVIDNTDTRHYPVADLRKAVGYVSQETELFSGSLKDNLTLAGNGLNDTLEECAAISGVAAFAHTHPLGYEMPVGERGKEISGGQRQSVGIARVMLANPKLLFLDEPTSQMDNLTEAAFIRGFRQWLSPETTLMVATHRSSLLELVDRLIIMEKGKIIADGPRDKVLASLGKTKLTEEGAKS